MSCRGRVLCWGLAGGAQGEEVRGMGGYGEGEGGRGGENTDRHHANRIGDVGHGD